MDFIPPYAAIALLGAGLTLISLVAGAAIGLTRDRGAWTTTLIAIALFYIVFAVEGHHASSLALNIAVGGSFIALAVVGHLRSLWFVVAGLALHGLFDVIYHGFETNPAPDWWGPICLGIDGVLAIWLAVMLRRGQLRA